MHIATSDSANMRGVFTMRVLDRKGMVVHTYEDHNMIVNGARVAMSMLVGDGTPGKVITKFGVGDNADVAKPVDTKLTHPYINTVIGHEFPEPGTVKFLWALDYTEANNLAICEFGLFCKDGTLFSRKVRSVIGKESDLRFEGEWSIIF